MNDETMPLLPCPFCGGEVSITYTDQVDAVTFCAHIECDGCDIDFARQYGAPNAQIAEEEAKELWNTRAQASATEGEAVAWQYREPGKPWRTVSKSTFDKYREGSGYEWRELFTRRNAKAGEVEIDPSDLAVEAWPRDPGGMRVYNPRGVLITHKPTGLVVQCSHERSQHRNRDAALRAIAAALSTHDKTKA